jgi:DNA-directed RNA polymerase beta' subunit
LLVSPSKVNDDRRKCLSETGTSDEMNVSIPQEIGLIEAMTIGSAVYHVVTAQSGHPIMGPAQNTLVMAGVCTNIFDSPRMAGDLPTGSLPDGRDGYEIMISRNTAHDSYTQAGFTADQIRSYLRRVEKVYPEYVERSKHGIRFAEYINGKVLYSIVFPQNLRWKRETKTNAILPMVEIWDGILTRTSGPLCKSCIGGTSGSIIHVMWREHPRTCKDFINRLVMISGVLNYRVGFSFSFGDCQATELASQKIKIAIEEANQIVRGVLNKGLDTEDEEKEVNRAYGKVREISPTLVKNMKKGMHSSLAMLTTFGIKGNLLNVSQTAGITGQQNLGGGRIPWGCTFQTRMTPHYVRNDKDPKAKGFITNCYLDGLDYKESFAAAIAGREGVIATGTRTADSGYIQKKMTKKLGDVKAFPDGSLRNAQGQIISAIYGGDGLSAKMKIASHSPENGVVEGLKRSFFSKIDYLVLNLESDLERLVSEAEEKVPIGKENKKEKKERLARTEEKRLISLDEATAIASGIVAGSPGYQSVVTEQSTKNQRGFLIAFLTTVNTYPSILPDLAEKLVEDYERAKVYDGYPAGLVACLSIGEILTQLTLNTFQASGIGEKNVSLGMPRLNETVNVTWDPKKPGMTIFLRDQSLDRLAIEILDVKVEDKEAVKIKGLKRCEEIASTIRYQTVGSFLSTSTSSPSILRMKEYDPLKESPLSFEGLHEDFVAPEWLSFFLEEFGLEPIDENIEWVIRLDLDAQRVFDSNTSPWEVGSAIEKYYSVEDTKTSVRCIPSPTSVNQILIFLDPNDAGNYAKDLLAFGTDEAGGEGAGYLYTENNIPYFAAREIAKILTTVSVQGISGITKASPRLESSKNEWVIDTQGTNFLEVLADDYVDPTRTISDHIREVEAVLGIEAARAFVEEELKKIIRFDGAVVDDCHFSVVVDDMSWTGVLTPISRHGISREVGPISKLMFERPIVEATNSVVYGDVDQVRTIDAAIFMGQAPKLGTGAVKVISGEVSRSSIESSRSRIERSEGETASKGRKMMNDGKKKVSKKIVVKEVSDARKTMPKSFNAR